MRQGSAFLAWKLAVAVIAPISTDHTEFLGDTLTAIAGEKAGIIKRDVPVICAEQPPEARQVALDHPLQVGHPTVSPVVDVLRREQLHAHEDIDRHDDLAVREDLRHRLRHAREERIVAEVVDGRQGPLTRCRPTGSGP